MTRSPVQDDRRRVPSVDRLLQHQRVRRLTELYGREAVRAEVRRELERVRGALGGAGETEAGEPDARVSALAESVAERIESTLGASLRRVINATGIFLHTNLGRAPLPRPVADRLPRLLDAYCDLELDLASGRRGERNRRAEALLMALTGAEAALVANNNAGALVLILATLAAGREVIVSRGELVEIGGSFRIPEILAAAGARLVEVGTTNRTRLGDYANALGPRTGALLKVIPSNYRVTGFVAAVGPEALVELGRRRQVPVVVDEGSGLLRPHPAPQLADHPSFRELLAAGCDLVCGSGDKLLGGPQAGLVAGDRDLVLSCRRHPLYRALRPDRSTFATLEDVLRLHLAGEELPLARLWPDPVAHRRRLERLAGDLGADIVPAEAFVGGGSAPERPIAGEALSLPGDDDLLLRLRLGEPPVVGYLRTGRLVLDLRTVDPAADGELLRAVRRARGSG